MSRQEEQPESRLVCQQPKRARQQDNDAQLSITPSIPRTLTSLSTSSPLTTSPSIRSFQDNMTSWMSCLISQQDGCVRMVAQQASVGRLRQEQLEQAVAMRTSRGPSPDRDQVQYLRDQSVHREAQVEHIRSKRDTHFVQEEELPAHTRLFKSETKDWK